uniref:N-acetyltransferase domain-containing protein n=1 Tax=Mantoniella antarctica TaxID=81844 RepID=A0A7S0SW22_9CHLO|mmetsp:Transcript_37712/g.93760  ORF Transcript_37712/g.93760 Transcript_37712/m.93760 type:complete len:280 (+) Transcript_37712:99-938(+)
MASELILRPQQHLNTMPQSPSPVITGLPCLGARIHRARAPVQAYPSRSRASFKPPVSQRSRAGASGTNDSRPSRAKNCGEPGITLRPGIPSDLPAIQRAIFTERMNPLGLDPSRFVVAVDEAREVVGFGQLKSWERLSDRSGDLLGTLVRALGLTPNWRGALVELSSLVVVASRRGEGIGSALLHQLVSDAVAAEGTAGGEAAGVGAGAGADEDADAGVTLCLLTLRATSPFYQRAGFVLIEKETDVPRPLQAERAAGGLVAALVAQDDCVVMKWERRR